MKSRSILFSASMVLAILREVDPKSQTRRMPKMQPCEGGIMRNLAPGIASCQRTLNTSQVDTLPHGNATWTDIFCQHGAPGDRLIVKEHVWMFCERRPNGTTPKGRPKFRYEPLRAAGVFYCANHPSKPTIGVVHAETGNQWGWRKKLARFMPSWASRITLELTAVRVERLQDISESDALAEGITGFPYGAGEVAYGTERLARGVMASDPRVAYRRLWESINGPGSWDANPWVFVESFRRVTP